ncbi:hypothetical protein M747DRAFT_294168 [Aspergillus niger ATCC 13496]|uniref:Secreted protein n=1 Tax=Aspergillus niger ATCC 13496 TaxID=1353008 RepID=A0A370C9W8_ASPNG|nr:hypothetical protein M747DRAFT_294168 [Aspergillus niger ATCC 13496]
MVSQTPISLQQTLHLLICCMVVEPVESRQPALRVSLSFPYQYANVPRDFFQSQLCLRLVLSSSRLSIPYLAVRWSNPR